ncbi:MAG: HDOD domain-containing protein, partial [Rubrivivax sp.]
AVPHPARLGRFELKRALGRGAQATVWLANDPRLEREVAVKRLNPGADALSVSQWLHEARAVSRLNHPHIVPVFEADQQGREAWLVFEYVAGPTLAEAMKGKGAWPAREAVTLMLGVLSALAEAQAQGIVHRDLKPSNVLIGSDGRARVMDFGIAARIAGPGAAGRSDPIGIVGTPGYISPEAARAATPTPAMDVFSAGVVLAELLGGARLLREPDTLRALARVQQEDLKLAATAAVDDKLRGIVQRALARDPAKRYAGAQELHDALAEWLQPEAEEPAPGAGHGTLDFLLRRMRNKGDFPALSESVGRIQKVATSETESLASLSAEILKDVALTNKLLRMVNTAHFSQSGGAVSTVSRAVALVGFAGIRNMALSLVLMEHMRDKAHATLLREEFLRALMAGTLADELTPNARDGEEAFLGSMFQNLGRLLTEYYFPEEALQVRQQLPAGEAAAAQREKVSAQVLGIGYEELGVAIAKSWGLPDTLQRAMRPPAGDTPGHAVERGVERQRWAGRAGNEIVDAVLFNEGDALKRRLAAIGEKYATALGLPAKDIAAAVEAARPRLTQLTQAMGLQMAPGSQARRLLVGEKPAADPVMDSLAGHLLQPTVVMDGAAAAAAKPMAELLAAGIQDITNSMVADNFKLNEVLRMVLETMYRALGFRRIVFCLRDPKTEMLTGRFGLGDDATGVSRVFKVALKPKGTPDLFAAVCAKGVDTLIADATSANIAPRLPAWYREGVNAPSFLLLPMAMKNAAFALIYADKDQPGSLVLGEKELSLLRTLRNQAVMAFRQSGAG